MFCVICITSCKSTKFVPDGEYILASVTIKSDTKDATPTDLKPFVAQKANYKTFELFKFPLFVYNLSGKDSTKWINKILRSGGEPPVIFDREMVTKTENEFKQILANKGYLSAEVKSEVRLLSNKKKARVTYEIIAGEPHTINNYSVLIPDSVFPENVYSGTALSIPNRRRNVNENMSFDDFLLSNTLVKPQSLLDLNVLDEERGRISSVFRNSGFYSFNKDYVGFIADTTQHRNVGLELTIYPFRTRISNNEQQDSPHQQYTIRNVYIYVDYNPLEVGSVSEYVSTSEVKKNGYTIVYGKRKEYIKPDVILNACYIMPGRLYSENMTNVTYDAMSQLRILRNVNISYSVKDSLYLDCIITCMPDKKQGISIEAEGTNSAGDFGVGAGIGYTHRNIFKGSEQFNIKLHGAYEAINASFSNFEDNYFEIGGETSLMFPRFINPFLTRKIKRRLRASTQITANFSYQRRPNYFTRTISGGSLKYMWNQRRDNKIRHTLDLLDVSYIHLPYVDANFLADLTPEARLYSFQDQFIMSAGYSYYYSNHNFLNKRQNVIKTFRASVETAGNVLALAANITDVKENEDGSKKVFNTTFAQYVKANMDFSSTYRLDEKNSIAWRIGGGIAYPYGNSKLIPIQKRFFSGGANSVRGWGIRELGPGAYYNENDNFYFHSGDIRFDANIEYRSKAFWIVEFAAFLDAGNIWTVKEYEGQEKGNFKFDSFYKEIAASWGLGIRFDFDFVLVRLDCGWKLHDPADKPGNNHWPVLEPLRFKKNTAWHIAIGYPF
ncbi:outer membrane protein assembly factor [Dysgonomonas sp. 520]|nr:BamA/TamA family outer membrane protein [Dysgonomonas sp. 520]NDW09197.1 outer membrane protein assembly factor [Dysgonomonas sp. 520]